MVTSRRVVEVAAHGVELRAVGRRGVGVVAVLGRPHDHATRRRAPRRGVGGWNSGSASARAMPAPGVASASSRKSDAVTARSWRRNSSGIRATASAVVSASAPPRAGSGLATLTPSTSALEIAAGADVAGGARRRSGSWRTRIRSPTCGTRPRRPSPKRTVPALAVDARSAGRRRSTARKSSTWVQGTHRRVPRLLDVELDRRRARRGAPAILLVGLAGPGAEELGAARAPTARRARRWRRPIQGAAIARAVGPEHPQPGDERVPQSPDPPRAAAGRRRRARRDRRGRRPRCRGRSAGSRSRTTPGAVSPRGGVGRRPSRSRHTGSAVAGSGASADRRPSWRSATASAAWAAQSPAPGHGVAAARASIDGDVGGRHDADRQPPAGQRGRGRPQRRLPRRARRTAMPSMRRRRVEHVAARAARVGCAERRPVARRRRRSTRRPPRLARARYSAVSASSRPRRPGPRIAARAVHRPHRSSRRGSGTATSPASSARADAARARRRARRSSNRRPSRSPVPAGSSGMSSRSRNASLRRVGDLVEAVEQVLAEEGEQLDQRDAGVARVVVGPLRRVDGDAGDQLVAQLGVGAVVEDRGAQRHRAHASR